MKHAITYGVIKTMEHFWRSSHIELGANRRFLCEKPSLCVIHLFHSDLWIAVRHRRVRSRLSLSSYAIRFYAILRRL